MGPEFNTENLVLPYTHPAVLAIEFVPASYLKSGYNLSFKEAHFSVHVLTVSSYNSVLVSAARGMLGPRV
jgi:hypothetical protein